MGSKSVNLLRRVAVLAVPPEVAVLVEGAAEVGGQEEVEEDRVAPLNSGIPPVVPVVVPVVVPGAVPVVLPVVPMDMLPLPPPPSS